VGAEHYHPAFIKKPVLGCGFVTKLKATQVGDHFDISRETTPKKSATKRRLVQGRSESPLLANCGGCFFGPSYFMGRPCFSGANG